MHRNPLQPRNLCISESNGCLNYQAAGSTSSTCKTAKTVNGKNGFLKATKTVAVKKAAA